MYKGMKIHRMPGDGACYFHAIAAAISGHYAEYLHLPGKISYKLQLQVRANIQEHVVSKMPEFYDFLTISGNSDDMTEDELREARMIEVKKLTKKGEWTGQLAIAATASLLRRPIVVHTQGMQPQQHLPLDQRWIAAPIDLLFTLNHYDLLERPPYKMPKLMLKLQLKEGNFGLRNAIQMIDFSCGDTCNDWVLASSLAVTDALYSEKMGESRTPLDHAAGKCDTSLIDGYPSRNDATPLDSLDASGLDTAFQGIKTCAPENFCSCSLCSKYSYGSQEILQLPEYIIPLPHEVSEFGDHQSIFASQIWTNDVSSNPYDALAKAILGNAEHYGIVLKQVFRYLKTAGNAYDTAILNHLRTNGSRIPATESAEKKAVKKFFKDSEQDIVQWKETVLLMASQACRTKIVVYTYDDQVLVYDGGLENVDDVTHLTLDVDGVYDALG